MSSSERTTVTPGTGLGASVRRTARTSIPNAAARVAMADPMPPRPTRPSVRPSSPPSSVQLQCGGGSCTHASGSRFSWASITASTHSEIGTAPAPREQVTIRPSRISGGMPSTPVPKKCTHSTPLPHSSIRLSARWVATSTSPLRSGGSSPLSGATTTSASGAAAWIAPAMSPPMWVRMRIHRGLPAWPSRAAEVAVLHVRARVGQLHRLPVRRADELLGVLPGVHGDAQRLLRDDVDERWRSLVLGPASPVHELRPVTEPARHRVGEPVAAARLLVDVQREEQVAVGPHVPPKDAQHAGEVVRREVGEHREQPDEVEPLLLDRELRLGRELLAVGVVELVVQVEVVVLEPLVVDLALQEVDHLAEDVDARVAADRQTLVQQRGRHLHPAPHVEQVDVREVAPPEQLADEVDLPQRRGERPFVVDHRAPGEPGRHDDLPPAHLESSLLP